MSAFDTYRMMRDSTIQNNRMAEQDALEADRRNALSRAGKIYAAGDATGARNALLDRGMIDEGLQIERYDRQSQAQAREQQQAQRERQKAALVASAQGLRRLPMDQRWQAYQTRVLPVLQSEGVGQDILSQITDQVMTDADLDAVIMMSGGEVQQPRIIQGQRGALDVIDPYTQEIRNVRQAARDDAPNGYRWTEDGSLEPIKGGPADPRQAGTLAASRRAPRSNSSRSGGSSSARSAAPRSGASSLPPGFRVR